MIVAVQHNQTGETGENGGNSRFSLADKTGETGEKPIRLSPAVVISPVVYCASAKGMEEDVTDETHDIDRSSEVDPFEGLDRDFDPAKLRRAKDRLLAAVALLDEMITAADAGDYAGAYKISAKASVGDNMPNQQLGAIAMFYNEYDLNWYQHVWMGDQIEKLVSA
jgi:hypothetical protein